MRLVHTGRVGLVTLLTALVGVGCAGGSESPDAGPQGDVAGPVDASPATDAAAGEVRPTDAAGPPDAPADAGQADAASDAVTGPDAGGDVADAGGPMSAWAPLAEEPADAAFTLPGLEDQVEVFEDDNGVPHVVARTWHDAFLAQGYLHARDRFVQMELTRRSTGGTLAELVGKIDKSAIDDDIFARAMGFRRTAQAVYDALDPASPERRMLDAYAEGVNAWIARYRSGEVGVAKDVAWIVPPEAIADWSPVDSIVIVRYQGYALGFDGFREIALTNARVASEEAFAEDDPDSGIALRHRAYADLIRWAPADPAVQFPHFAEQAVASNPPPSAPPGALAPSVLAAPWQPPSRAALQAARAFLDHFRSRFSPARALAGAISNNWVVDGAHTTSGAAVLANDPHLGLDSPPLFYFVHLVVEPRDEASGPALDAQGAGFPGVPGVLLGHNEHVAWGTTTASYDYSDAYVEKLVWKDGEKWPRVEHNGEEVPLDVYTETVQVGLLGNVNPDDAVEVELPWVPHRGPLALNIHEGTVDPIEGDEAISFAWKGFAPTPELHAVVGIMLAHDLDEVRIALEDWIIGGANFVFADREGHIFSSGHSFIPLRPQAATTWDPATNPDGTAPWWTLSGTGEHDWVGALPMDLVPHGDNAEQGFVVTANNDQAGVTLDNDPLDDYAYVGYDYDIGFRAGRIERRLRGQAGPVAPGAKLTLDDIGDIQHDTHSGMGERLTPFLLTAADRLLEELDAPGTHPELAWVIDEVGGGDVSPERIAALRDLLAAWSFNAADGLWGEPTEADQRDARATSLFNVWQVAAIQRAFFDEMQAAPGLSPGSQRLARAILFLLEHPEDAVTYDPDAGESVLWDDLATPDRRERSDAILAAALLDADAKLTELFGTADTDAWLWGKLHTLTFDSLVPMPTGVSPMSWPQPDEGWPDGYPRPGDNFNVNVCNAGVTDYKFTCGTSAIMRFVVEMGTDAIRAFNVLPGGQVWDPDSPHFRDLLQLWLDHERVPMPFTPSEVADHLERHLQLLP